MAYEDFELDLDSDDWSRRDVVEAERDRKMAKASKFLDDFFELELDAGARRLTHAEQNEILNLAPDESAWQSPRPAQPPQPDALQPIRDFVKTEREKVRQQPSVTRAEVKSSLIALSHLFGKVANGGL